MRTPPSWRAPSSPSPSGSTMSTCDHGPWPNHSIRCDGRPVPAANWRTIAGIFLLIRRGLREVPAQAGTDRLVRRGDRISPDGIDEQHGDDDADDAGLPSPGE